MFQIKKKYFETIPSGVVFSTTRKMFQTDSGDSMFVSRAVYDMYSNVTFDAAGGTLSYDSKKYVVGKKYEEFPNATYTNYRLQSWRDDNGNEVTKNDYVKAGDRTLHAQWVKSQIPSGYTQLQYATNSDGAYVDLNLHSKPSQTWEIKVTPTGTTRRFMGNSYAMIATSSSTSNKFIPYYCVSWNDTHSVKLSTFDNPIVIKLKMYDGWQKQYIDGVLDASSTKSYSAEGSNIYLFASNHSELSSYSKAVSVYYLKIYQDDAIVMSLVPCKDTSGTTCMYDLINDVTYYVQNGSLTAGPEI